MKTVQNNSIKDSGNPPTMPHTLHYFLEFNQLNASVPLI